MDEEKRSDQRSAANHQTRACGKKSAARAYAGIFLIPLTAGVK
jgi:hypothetical protein